MEEEKIKNEIIAFAQNLKKEGYSSITLVAREYAPGEFETCLAAQGKNTQTLIAAMCSAMVADENFRNLVLEASIKCCNQIDNKKPEAEA